MNRTCLPSTKHAKDEMRDQLFLALDLLGSLPSAMVIAVGDQVMSGVISLLEGREDLVKYVSSTKKYSSHPQQIFYRVDDSD